MNFRIKSIEQLSLKDMPYLLQPFRACGVLRSILHNSKIYGLDNFINQQHIGQRPAFLSHRVSDYQENYASTRE